MKVNEIGSDVPVEPEDLFEMANLYPSTTGLPMTVWVSPRGNAHHELRVRVNVTHGNQIDIVRRGCASARIQAAAAPPGSRHYTEPRWGCGQI